MTSTATTTLASFLLDRIAEDEAVARTNVGRVAWVSWGDEDGPGPGIEGMPWRAWWDSTRVLAECQAKRRIVEMAADVSAMDQRIEDEWGLCGSVPFPDAGDEILLALAAPYADAPGFREEWR